MDPSGLRSGGFLGLEKVCSKHDDDGDDDTFFYCRKQVGHKFKLRMLSRSSRTTKQLERMVSGSNFNTKQLRGEW